VTQQVQAACDICGGPMASSGGVDFSDLLEV
jgi:hypothetical protein